MSRRILVGCLFALGIVTWALFPSSYHHTTSSLGAYRTTFKSSGLGALWSPDKKFESTKTQNFTWELPLIYEGRETIVDGLNPNNRYLLALPYAGFTNQVMCAINCESQRLLPHARTFATTDRVPSVLLVYGIAIRRSFSTVIHLAKLSGKIPILPAFTADMAHLHDDSVLEIKMSDVFDLDRLALEFDMPWVELDDIRPRFYPNVGFGSSSKDTRPVEILPSWGMYATTNRRCYENWGIDTIKDRNMRESKVQIR